MVLKELPLLEHFGVSENFIYSFVLIVFAIAGVAVFEHIPETGSNELQSIYLSVKDCNVQEKKCKVETKEFNVEISMDENIFYLKRFNIAVLAENNEKSHIESIKVSFKMKNMNMGNNHFILKKVKSINNKKSWKGDALLPICVTGRADWFSELEVVTQKNKYIIGFPIFVKKAS